MSLPPAEELNGAESKRATGVFETDSELQGDHEVLMVPLPGSYADEFVAGLEAHGATVRTSDGKFRVLSGFLHGGVPDVLHLHFLHRFFVTDGRVLSAALGIQFLLELCLARVLGVKVVWTVHNLTAHDSPQPRLESVIRHLTTYLCTAIIVHCGTAGTIITREYNLPARNQRKIRTVPHGNYTERYPDEISSAQARAELELDPEERVFLFFGQIRPYKQVEELIETFERLDADNVTLLVVGNPVDEEIETRVREVAENDDNVRTVFEFVPDEDVQRYMRAADVVVLPYGSILTSGSVLLAMTFERPVVAPALGCVGELLDTDGGFPYDPAEEEGLLTALQEAATAPLVGMGESNYEKVRHLDWYSIAGQTLRVYEAS